MAIAELETLKTMGIDSIGRDTIQNIKSEDIDTSLSIEERYKNLLEQSINPYFFRCDDTIVKVEFTDNNLSLQQALTDTLIRKKGR